MLKKIDKDWTRNNRKIIMAHKRARTIGFLLFMGGITLLTLCTYLRMWGYCIGFSTSTIIGAMLLFHADTTLQIFLSHCRILDALKVEHGIEDEDF